MTVSVLICNCASLLFVQITLFSCNCKNSEHYIKLHSFSSSVSDGCSNMPLSFSPQTSSPNSSNENSPVSPPDEQNQGEAPPQLEEEEPAFPHTDLAKLDDMINRCFYAQNAHPSFSAWPPCSPAAYQANCPLLQSRM